MAWRIHCETPEGTPMILSAMSRERAISFARELERLGDRILRIEADDGEVLEAGALVDEAGRRAAAP